MTCDVEPHEGEPIFVIVHGTWGARSGWTREGSKLCTAVGAQWPSAGFYRFNWSGTNGLRHRLLAAEVLSVQLDILALRFPASRVVTVAHSHGGNVVAWASTRLLRPLECAIYLNTPFIQALRGGDALVLRIVMYVVSTVILVPLSVVVPDMLYPKRSDGYGWALLLGLAGSVVAIALLQIIVPRRVKSIREQLVAFSNGSRKILGEFVIYVVGDEPSAAFGAVYFAQWLGRRITAVALVLAFGGSLTVIFNLIPEETYVNTYWTIFLLCAFVPYLVALIFSTAGYGFVQALVALDCSIAVTPAPVGRAEFVTIAWSALDRLRHSLIYESPDAIGEIIRWIDSALRGVPSPSDDQKL